MGTLKTSALRAIARAKMAREGKKQLAELQRQCENANAEENALLQKLLRDNENTEYGKRYNFKDIHTVEDYQKQVPLSTYDNYAEYIERMLAGEKDLITTYPIMHYALTSGSVDNPKSIPVSQQELDIYSAYTGTLMSGVVHEHIRKTKGRKPNKGLSMMTIEVKKEIREDGTTRGPISARAFIKLEPLLHLVTNTPNQAVYPQDGTDTKYLKARYGLQDENMVSMTATFMTSLVEIMRYIEANWEMLVTDIELGRIDESIKLPDAVRAELSAGLQPNPTRAAALRREFQKGFDTPIIPRIWPQMEYAAAIGTGGFAIYTEKMREYAGSIPFYFCIYGASEGLFAAATAMDEGEYALIPEGGFYEFIPTDAEDDTKTLTIDQLEVGKCYEIVVTNLSGFYRYRIGDVVRMLGYQGQSPKIAFVYRKNQMVSIAGEKTTEEHLAWCVQEFSRETGEEIVDFSVYPDTTQSPPLYRVFLEPRRHLPKERGEEYSRLFDAKLCKSNPSVGSKVQTGVFQPTQVVLLQQETYTLYREMMVMKGVSPNQLKPVRVLDTPLRENFFFTLIDKE